METLKQIAVNYNEIFLMLHLFALVLGLGGATYSDILLVRFLKDWEIDEKEAEVIETMSKVILVGIMLAFLSGFFLFLPKAAELLQTPKFILKNLIFVVLVVNGFILHKVILPKLLHFSFKENHYLCDSNCFHLRHASFICGAISVVSWYSVFFIGSFRSIPLSFGVLLAIYLVALFGAIGGALTLERILWKQVNKKKSAPQKKQS